jgi:long-chain acyl-CoA synthetase
MERIWVKSYPPGIPADVRWDDYASVGALVEACTKRYADRVAFSCMGKDLTFAELDRLSRDFAAWLQSKGLRKGDRVALMMPNVLQYPIALYGTLRAGLVVVNVNPLYTPRELEHQLKDSGAETIVILENFANTLEQVIAKTPVKNVVVASMGDMLGFKGVIVNFVVRHVKKMVPAYNLPGALAFRDVLDAGDGKPMTPYPTGQEDIAFLQYTGGTTGVSKGAVLLHRNILANVEQAGVWLLSQLKNVQPVIVTPLPLYHIFSLTVNCLMMMKAGGKSVLIPNPRDIPGFIKELRGIDYNIMSGVNTLYNALMNHPDFKTLSFTAPKIFAAGGMAVQEAVAKRWKQMTGFPLVEGYGLTETSPIATTNPLNLDEWSGTIGVPLPSTEVIIRSDDGKVLPIGERGEICIKGPQVMQGYWQRPDETAKVMTPDGYFMTGDIGIMDERGFIKIVDRKKDMILVSGFNVYPNEIEGVLAAHPGVLEVAAVGVPDPHSSEAVKLFIVKKDPALTEADVKAYCEEHLTGYKRPRHIEFRNELPKTNVGKILRRALRDEELAKGKKAA